MHALRPSYHYGRCGVWQDAQARPGPAARPCLARSVAGEDAAPAAAAATPSAAALAAAAPPQLSLRVQLSDSMAAIDQAEWDACATGGGELNPFVLWEFLHILEASGSAVKEQGWLPQHLLVRDDATGELLGCAPMYLKGHSFGEYVFDNSWGTAYERYCGRPYYPKLQCCVPFTPVTGPRLLTKAGSPYEGAVRRAMADTLIDVATQLGVSSLHMTFNTREEALAMASRHGYMARTGLQYHWSNQGYRSFEDYLAALKQSRRKAVRQERKRAAETGLSLRRLRGEEVTPAQWRTFYQAYLDTADRKWGNAYLTPEFFSMLGERMGQHVLLVAALEPAPPGGVGGGKLVAGALNLVGDKALFGRNWGCTQGDAFKSLHFELCFYQALEHAIELGLERVEAGAQGEHKLQRGYLPVPTYSSHWVADRGFKGLVSDFLRQEARDMELTREVLAQEASPFKAAPPA